MSVHQAYASLIMPKMAVTAPSCASAAHALGTFTFTNYIRIIIYYCWATRRFYWILFTQLLCMATVNFDISRNSLRQPRCWTRLLPMQNNNIWARLLTLHDVSEYWVRGIERRNIGYTRISYTKESVSCLSSDCVIDERWVIGSV